MWGAIGGILGVGGSIMEGIGAKDATKDYNEELLKQYAAARDWSYQRFLESRGQGGQALLPMYFPRSTETQLSGDTLGTYNAMRAAAGTPTEEIAAYQAAAQGMMPAMSGADALVNKLFNGQLTEEQIRNIAPVLAARGAVAKSQKVGILEGLTQRLNALSADRARSGYTGGGSAFQKNQLIGATIPAMQAAGTVGAQADLANATDVANLRNAGINTALSNLNLPLNQAVNRMQLIQSPQAAASAAQAGRLNLFNWFKMQPQAFRWDQTPQEQLVPNDLMIAGSAIKSAGQGASSFGSAGGLGSVGL